MGRGSAKRSVKITTLSLIGENRSERSVVQVPRSRVHEGKGAVPTYAKISQLRVPCTVLCILGREDRPYF